ncbi:large-conductance mechanosensitive channel protein MscL [Bacillus sp. FJAT-45066]|uniref:large-conductance mechanosensitive channel protein MscL n=1 Tax=Bacillus sp. FJAT-45066 TaxID=2011010 RepID=UPI000BB8FA1A|nr:large-conductance mechanosensitive channel protein MscL [Bacillus sp. FJAT-45066]
MFRDFKQFAVKGNVIDLAFGVVIGSAFGNIVSSLVNDIMMPLFGVLLGGINLTNQRIIIGQAVVKYGLFLQTIVDFLIIAFSIFLCIRFLQKLRSKEKKDSSNKPSEEVIVLTEIRDLLKEEKQRKPKLKVHIK